MKACKFREFILLALLALPVYAGSSIPELVTKISPSVVMIYVHDAQNEGIAQGSGFFISDKCNVVTNYHVIAGSIDGAIKTSDGKYYAIKYVLDADIAADVALLSVDMNGAKCKPLKIEQTIPKIGESLIVIGSPLGLEQTVTSGILSSIREIPQLGSILQISAPISHGSSGSPVLNMAGNVIGVARASLESGQSINFAVPCAKIMQLKNSGVSSLEVFNYGNETVHDLDLLSASENYALGYDKYLSKDYAKAVGYFEKCLQLDSKYNNAHFSIGICYLELNEFEKAVSAFLADIVNDPEAWETYHNLAYSYLHLEDWPKAIEAFAKEISLNPNPGQAHRGMGNCYFQMALYDDALNSYFSARKYDPRDASILLAIEKCYFNLKQYEKAMEATRKYIELLPDSPIGYYYLGALQKKLGRIDDAIIQFNAAIYKDTSYADAYYSLCDCYSKKEQWDLAIRNGKKSIELNPQFAAAYACATTAMATREEFADAIALLKAGAAIIEKNGDLVVLLANLYGIVGKNEEALAVLDAAVQKESDIRIVMNIYDTKADLYWAQGNYKACIEIAEKALSIKGDEIRILVLKGEALMKVQRFKDAIIEYEKAIALGNNQIGVRYNLACAYARINNKNKMLVTLQNAIEIDEQAKIAAQKDTDFDSFRDDADFKEIIK